jgi:hypothetical protein
MNPEIVPALDALTETEHPAIAFGWRCDVAISNYDFVSDDPT